MEEHFSGLRLHELLGLTFAIAFAIHIILHFDWIVSITRPFFKKLLHESRLNYVLNIALFIDMISVTVTGILISRTLSLGISLGQAQQMVHMLHILSSRLVLVIVALHVGLHWKWIATNARKYLFSFNLTGRKVSAQPVHVLSQVEAK